MLSKIILFFLLFQTFAIAEEVFRVAPYTLRHTNGQLILNFQLNDDKNLIIIDGKKTIKAIPYKKAQQYQIELGNMACDEIKDVTIVEAQNNNPIYQKSFSGKSCFSRPGDLIFGFISDTQLNLDKHEMVASVIAQHHAIEPLQFIINGGDIVENGYAEKEWLDYFKGGKEYLMDIPQIAAVGNHDYRRSHGLELPKYFKQFMRWDGAEKYGNLFFDFPEMQLIVFNSNMIRMTVGDTIRLFQWIESKMQEAQKANKTLILATHFPVYSSSLNQITSQSVIILQKYMVPLLEKYNIPLILSGHTHMYERSLKANVNYLVAGPAGGKPNTPSADNNPYKQYFDTNARTFTKIKYSQKVFTLETYNELNQMIDSLVIQVRK